MWNPYEHVSTSTYGFLIPDSSDLGAHRKHDVPASKGNRAFQATFHRTHEELNTDYRHYVWSHMSNINFATHQTRLPFV